MPNIPAEQLSEDKISELLSQQSELVLRLALLTLGQDPENPLSWTYAPAEIVGWASELAELWQGAVQQWAASKQAEPIKEVN